MKIDKYWRGNLSERCVVIFRRPDGTPGVEEFRRNVKDTSDLLPIGGHSDRAFGGV